MNKRISVLSIPIDCVTMQEAIDRIINFTKEPGLHIVATANAEMVMLANQNPILHGILNSASLVIPDGAGILWAAEKQGETVPERVAGVDITKELFRVAGKEKLPIYCLGAAPGVAQQAVDNLQALVGPVPIAGVHDGFFDKEEELNIINEIKESKAKLVFVALGVPKQEEWISEHLASLDGVVAMGVGGSFDVLAGNIPRAPKWMQRNRLEWLYRLYLEPQRIGRMLAIPKFMWTVIRKK
ncbi:WecB/TagA/CpsF family glycosyltransferase [Veillonella agrestimuris]|uniref:WecB/TagA/CpsF family glycosyltransferase n=1 Tax=Veillonella agrestimuris TaxID=2941340 RepID=UPI00203A6937|nr:WecB/TagA/CpsF family glycosyltransferase [Veillonella agrestimuris]